MNPRISYCLVLTALLWTVGCGDDSMPSTPPDGGSTPWWERDADAPPMMPDSGGVDCRSDEHLCSGRCVENHPNEPEYGCALGCGEACPTPTGGRATCGDDGYCDVICDEPFERVGDSCICSPRTCDELSYVCGEWEDGCGGMLRCGTCEGGGACTDEGICGCAPDIGDTDPANNDTRARASMLGEFGDRGSDSEVYRIYTIDSRTDIDWFQVVVTDETDILPPYNPEITISLGDIPAGADYDLGAWFLCGSGGGETVECESGRSDDLGGDLHGCVSERRDPGTETVKFQTSCDGIDDSGILLIRIIARTYTGVCAPYELTFELN